MFKQDSVLVHIEETLVNLVFFQQFQFDNG